MAEKLTPHQRFIERFNALSPTDGEDEVLRKTGLDMFESAESIDSSVQHFRLFDATSGESIDAVTFQASLTPPGSFPREWPFVPEVDCTLTRTTAQGQPISVMYWVVEDNETPLRELVHRAMLELGWTEHAPTPPDADERHLLMWYHLGGEWRVLARRAISDVVGLVLSEARSDLLPHGGTSSGAA